ncbi:protease SohB [Legionella taurinensis]|uniref:Protease SohB n=1 Tax=Legionella taurinensis TaxID=70611 RepID=A0A3A5LIG7_9GAMM|nr:protease SohB [Legionella taurinensis]MDX1837929.1 protease SohB [Legionella taurinensis]PUT39476.1 protease SohB [Legionella taurinensis]PUT41785.1 protease SohB [Legionella taurinensis]PUT44619.1 protease SohB [Legionella taurinensis]PUT46863.1 protease SohB [Legionella taurinensis]
MEFLSDYGLFLLKSITLVIAILLVTAGLMALGRSKRPKLEIVSLNKEFNALKRHMNHEIKDIKEKKSRQKKKDKLSSKDKPTLFVLDFHGDIKASQTESLREAVNAVLSVAGEDDEVLLRLESPGGVVNGYGLAASQLQRIRDKNITLTVAIDKMAASGGYLMACVANRIIAAPFAIIGSIGVVGQLPNFNRWLKKHNIDFEMITAGEYKRTLTMFGENTEKGRQKFQEDLEEIHHAFRDYVLQNRQQLDIDKVATGEHWLAKDAFDLRLVDSLKTSDEYLMSKMEDYKVFKIASHHKPSLVERILRPAAQLLHPFA